ncbi:MAG: PilZ domain-containing protein, partial [Cyanobacteriota bacterium]
NVYSFSGIIVLSSTVRKLQPDQILIDYPVEKERVQRREYFRVSIQRPIEIYYNDGYKDRAYKGNTIDISGGGVRFWTKENLQVGFIANMVLHLTGFFTPYEPISANGRILYTKNHDSRLTSKAGYISVIKFHEISQKHRQLIMKTCFKLQIEMRKKGVL